MTPISQVWEHTLNEYKALPHRYGDGDHRRYPFRMKEMLPHISSQFPADWILGLCRRSVEAVDDGADVFKWHFDLFLRLTNRLRRKQSHRWWRLSY
jgi:hypothetical protein